MSEVKKSYYAIIPANVRYDEELTQGAKLLYGELTALSNDKGYCWASNAYFAKLYNTTNRTIIRWIGSLEKKGYIRTSMIYDKNTKAVKERRLYIVTGDSEEMSPVTKMSGGGDKNVMTPGDKNVTDNTTSSNTTSYKDIVEYLNSKAGTSYRPTTKKTQDCIKARFNEGFEEKDFQKVIDIKTQEWLGTDMEKFLRPETLFGNKFEGYLNQKPSKKQSEDGHEPSYFKKFKYEYLD